MENDCSLEKQPLTCRVLAEPGGPSTCVGRRHWHRLPDKALSAQRRLQWPVQRAVRLRSPGVARPGVVRAAARGGREVTRRAPEKSAHGKTPATACPLRLVTAQGAAPSPIDER